MDEISLKKGHKKYVTIETGRRGEQTIILAVPKDRHKVTVKAFLESIPLRIRRHVVSVCADMYEGFVNAAKEVFGKGIIIIDRFHKDITEDERSTLALLFQHSPALKLAYAFSQELTAIFDQDVSRRRAQQKIKVWKKQVKRSGLTCFNGFLKTLGTY